MMPKFNNIFPYKSISFNDKPITKRVIKNSNINKENKADGQNKKLMLQKELLKSKLRKNNNNSYFNKKNKNSFSKKSNPSISESQNIENDNKNTINDSKTKNKSNSVTNNICIIIKTSEKENEKKISGEYGYSDFLKKIYQNRTINVDHHHIKNNKSNSTFCRKTRNNIKKKIFGKLINVDISKKNLNSNVSKKNVDLRNNSNEYKYKNKSLLGISFQNIKNKNLKYNNNVFDSYDKVNAENSNCLFTNDFSGIFAESNGSLITSSLKKSKDKHSIKIKKKLLGNYVNSKRKNVKQLLSKKFLNHEKEMDKTEKKILLNNEIINDESIKNDYKYKTPKRIFSDYLGIKSYKNIKINKSVKNMKTEYNKNKGNRLAGLMKEGEKLITNSSPITKKNSILKMKKEKKIDNKRNNSNTSKRAINYNNKNDSIKKLSVHNSLLNIRSYMDLFIPESKIKKNANIIVHDIIKIMNTDKNKNKAPPINKIVREKKFSPSKDEIIMIQKNEHGKTLRCIKKRCKDKTILTEIKIFEGKNEEQSKIINYLNEDKEENKNEEEIKNGEENKSEEEIKKKEENKILEIRIPEQQIEALRRIKLKIENYKKSQEKYKRKEN